jgi:serine/threonine protein kinase
MDSERWRRLEQLYHAALEQEPARRDSFIAGACQEDTDLRREVQSLLAQRGSTGALTDRSAWAAVGGITGETRREWGSGQILGPYKILRLLGEGGMGAVYEALDTRLNRKVAVKVCHERFGGRFEREARAISALEPSEYLHPL